MSDRFARHALVPGWDQRRLTGATAVLLGVGGLGNEVARLLAMAGAGRLVLCDPDRVSVSNLSRTALFREGDVGRLKVEAAAAALRGLAPGVRVEARGQPLVSGVGLAELRDADVVVGCLDSEAARLQLAGRCGLVRARWLDGGTHAWGGEVRNYLSPDGPCYGCGLSPRQRAVSDAPTSCLDVRPAAEAAASAPVSAVVGSWLALQATRVLMGLPVPAGVMKIDGVRGAVVRVEVKRDPDCPYHMPLAGLTRVAVTSRDTVGDLRAALGEGAVPELWAPVQERAECPRCGHAEARWGPPRAGACPRCGAGLRPRTCMTLENAPAGVRLADLGVAPREVLPVRVGGGEVRCVELGG